MSKNLLSENMLRFGTKNLSEGAKRNLVLESVMQTIKEHGLYNEVKRRLMEFAGGKTAEEVADGLWSAFSMVGSSDLLGVVNNLQYIKTGADYNAVNELLFKNKGLNMVGAMKKYLPGEELTEVPAGKKTHALDELMRINYPGQYNAAVKAGRLGIDWGSGSPYDLDGTMYDGITTSNTTWQKTKRQMSFTTNRELRGGGGGD
jgi:hypothetical protein